MAAKSNETKNMKQQAKRIEISSSRSSAQIQKQLEMVLL